MSDKMKKKKKESKLESGSKSEERAKRERRKKRKQPMPMSNIEKESENTRNMSNANIDIDSSSSDEELVSRIGNVPHDWYAEYEHMGYNINSERVSKGNKESEIEHFLRRSKEKEWWREIWDDVNNRSVRLTDGDMEMIRRIRGGKFYDSPSSEYSHFIEFPWDGKHALIDAPEPKRRFIRSKGEMIKVNRLVHAIKMGWIKTSAQIQREEQILLNAPKSWDIWMDQGLQSNPALRPLPPPKRDLPSHAESYNCPNEYLLNSEEDNEWEEQSDTEREKNYKPHSYPALRNVPLYTNLIKENFERCLDLYICPRVLRKRRNIEAESLIPHIPDPNELRPFPSMFGNKYLGIQGVVRGISVSADGIYLAAGSLNGDVCVWDVATSRLLKKYTFEGEVRSVSWNPSKDMCILCIVQDNKLWIVNPGSHSKGCVRATDSLLAQFMGKIEEITPKQITWTYTNMNTPEYIKGYRVMLAFPHELKEVTWHFKGDYFATLAQRIQSTSQVLIHSLSKSHSQRPFPKMKGIIQTTQFHPSKPYFFLASERKVFMYNLQKQVLMRKYVSKSKGIESIKLHPGGDNLIIGSRDEGVEWFDLDLGETPYKSLKYQERGAKIVAVHQKYPLFASGAYDGTISICHGMVFRDLLKNPLLLPLKLIKAHKSLHKLGIFALQFHPSQPWIFSGGADGAVKLWV